MASREVGEGLFEVGEQREASVPVQLIFFNEDSGKKVVPKTRPVAGGWEIEHSFTEVQVIWSRLVDAHLGRKLQCKLMHRSLMEGDLVEVELQRSGLAIYCGARTDENPIQWFEVEGTRFTLVNQLS